MLLIMKVRLKFSDIIIILAALSLTVFSAYSAYMKTGTARVVIQAQGLPRAQSVLEWRFPMDASETVIVSGPLGDTVIKIQDKSAWVETSPCGNLTCVSAGKISRRGQWAACLPNKVLLIIEGAKDDVDTVVW
jgi:hypothetical protein